MITCARLAKAVNRSILEGECITIFRGAVRSSHTLDPYERRLAGFLNGIGKTCDEFVQLARTSPATTEASAFGDDSLLYPLIIKAISENIGKGTEYNNNLIDEPGATLTKIVTRTRLSYPQIKHYLQLLADQGLVTVHLSKKSKEKG